MLQDTEKLLGQLEKDQAAVDEVRAIVEAEEVVMMKETQVVQDNADVSRAHPLVITFDLATVIEVLLNAVMTNGCSLGITIELCNFVSSESRLHNHLYFRALNFPNWPQN